VGMSADEFPAMPSHNETKTFKIPAKLLGQMIDRTLFCVSTDDNRHNLSGIYCETLNKNTLRMVATDGHRLAMSENTFDFEVPIERGVIVPRKGFQELKRVLSDGDDNAEATVELGFSNNSGVLKIGSVTLSTRLVEGQFPDYRQVIPKKFDKTVTIHRAGFTESLRRVSLLSQSRAHGVRLNFSEGNLEMVAEDPEFGEARETLEIAYKAAPLSVGFNAKYILDVLALIRDEALRFELSDDLSPGVLKPLEEENFLAVIMPMRI